jgi:hypothetical protein
LPFGEAPSLRASHQCDRSMIITMVAVRMVQMPIDEVVDVIPVRNSFVPAVRSMNVVGIVSAAGMFRSTGFRICVADRNRVLFDFSTLGLVMKVAVVQIINVPVVLDRGVTATGTMLMIVVLVDVCHGRFLSLLGI